MRRLSIVLVFAIAAVSLLAFQPAATSDASAVEGVWKTIHVTITNEEGTEVREITQPNLLIFTESHYASVSVRGAEAREELPDEPTDEQLLAAWRPFNANAGTYSAADGEIATKVIVAKWPNATANQRENSAPFRLDGDNLVRTFTNGAGTTTWAVTYERVE
jgi:hypothetical protein